jgi:hypothetical protein
MTSDTIKKLEDAFMIGCSDLEACLAADISQQTLYNYQAANPSFLERKQRLKENPIMVARQSVYTSMRDNGELALKYLERKKKDEFSLKREVDINDTTVRVVKKRFDSE